MGKRSGWATPQTTGEKGVNLEAETESKPPKNTPKHSARPCETFHIDTSAKTPRAGPDPALIPPRLPLAGRGLFPDFQEAGGEAAVPAGARR